MPLAHDAAAAVDGAVSPERKKRRTLPHSTKYDNPITFASLELFRCRGFVAIPAFLTAHELTYLRHESDQLFAALDADPATAAEKIVQLGCVLDTMADCPMAEAAAARTDRTAYLDARTQQLRRSVSGSAASIETSSALEQLLFERLPRAASTLLDTTSEVFFFNEHFVVKPPDSNVEFRWHRDDDEQLGMCVHRERIAPYLSVWCALDDVTAENGPLRFVARDAIGGASDPVDVDTLKQLASEPLVVAAGTAVFFLSDLWHFSAANVSATARRAFYAQYSREPITATPRGDAPLSFAIACSPSPG